ncbi:DegT/DnrJ/EryC1/StrS family aminotransferase [Rickettsia endosymbiont of Lasioglossum villosulum]|uniref:DegT/DnrJ/EryC1/StrS family aminotransferase n=1 Tax=Rickettsia endosymbiont of Lasioglossum villosulum TaxID=3066269 RepID=UPI0031334A2C
MEIKFLDLKSAYTEIKQEADKLWQDVNNDASYLLGNRLEKFEQEFASYLGVKHVIGVANGLDALVLSLKALGIGAGDEVIVPAHTFIASWLAVSEIGAVPVPVEVYKDTYLLDPSKIEHAITSKTRAIMPVHLYGRVCDIQLILAIAKKYNLKIIEDAAQAHGAIDLVSGKKAGSFGDCNGFSFYPGKNLGCFGDGGCISTNDDKIADTLKLLRNYGSKVRYSHEIIGKNSRLDDLQAGILSIKLRYLNEWNKKRQRIAKIYLQELNINDIVLPQYDDGNVWHIFPIMTKKRDQLKDYLVSQGVQVIIHYPTPIYLQPAYQNMNLKVGSFELTEKISSEILSLPIGPHLTEEEAILCTKKIKEFFNRIG